MPKAARDDSIKGILVAWLVCLPIAFFFVQLTRDVPIRSAKASAAAFDWYGERGTVTVTHGKSVHDSKGNTQRHCFGDFRPDDGGAVVTDVRVHIDGGCRAGRTADARLLRKDTRSWLVKTKEDTAYAGTGAPIVPGVFMGLFCLVVGGPFIAFAAVFPVLMAISLVRRRGTGDA